MLTYVGLGCFLLKTLLTTLFMHRCVTLSKVSWHDYRLPALWFFLSFPKDSLSTEGRYCGKEVCVTHASCRFGMWYFAYAKYHIPNLQHTACKRS